MHFLWTWYNHTHFDQSKTKILSSDFLHTQSYIFIPWSHPGCFSRIQRCSSDTLSKLHNSSCFHLPNSSLCQSETLPHICSPRQGSSKLFCQLTRWRNILLNIFSASLSWQAVLMCRDKGRITACLGGSLTQDRLPLTWRATRLWWIRVMSHPPSDSSEMAV